MVREHVENGEYIFKLDELLKCNNVSINKLMRDTNTDFKVIKRLMGYGIVRADITVLARFCDYFNCEITDIIEYKPNKFKTCDENSKKLLVN